MYQTTKQLVKTILSKRLLIKVEPCFRSVLYLFYKGKRLQCNICNKNLRVFIQQDDGDKLCPFCGSLSRTRRLWELISKEYFKENMTILDFSPSRSLYRKLKKNTSIHYSGTDLSGDFLSDYQYDITNIDCESEKFDLIICYHILEHVENDTQAMKELHRVLKKGGFCIVQTPFKEGEMFEDFSKTTEEERLIHFGQKDHVRIYSINGLKERLINCEFQVEIKQYDEPKNHRFGFQPQETILICTK